MACSDSDRLLTVFGALLSPLLATGCSTGGIDASQFSFDVCSEDGYTMLESVVPSTAVDYLELRSAYDYDPTTTTLVDANGQACANAADPEACATALATLPMTSSFLSSFSFDAAQYLFLGYTRSDEVAFVTEQSDLLGFLGDIDSPGDAALRAYLDGRTIKCGAGPEVGEHAEGFVVFTTSGSGCGSDVEDHVLLVRADGSMEILESEVVEKGDPNCAIGRLPAGLCRRRSGRARNPVGAFLAEVATLEAAAVPAFAQLARELAAHQAPTALVRGALRGRDDEIRHARITARLARRFGGRPQRPRVRPTPARSLAAVAEDNAVEGCIRETYGALVAHVQARRARDPQLRRAFAQIAVDETRHAVLSWQLARWAEAQLGARTRGVLARRRVEAVERMRVELTAPLHPLVHSVTGMPEPQLARSLFDDLQGALGRA